MRFVAVVGLLVAVAPPIAQAQSGADSSLLARGEYIFKISGCRHCHTAEGGTPLAGGHALETPFGIFYTPNIPPHPTAGIGGWSAQDLRRALHLGVSPAGDDYYPSFPFTSYTGMLAEDVDALHAYLMSLPASDQPNREHELDWFLISRLAATAWKLLFFSPGEFQLDPAKGSQWNRGAYIAEALGHCAECHTPRDVLGTLQTDRPYAGNAEGPDGELVPNITSHDTGIGDWSRDALSEFLKYGELPNGEYTSGSMEPVIEGIRHLTEQDREALIDFLRSLPPIDNRVSK